MTKRQLLTAENRSLSGRKVKGLRRQGKIPANIFGKKVKSLSVQVDSLEFTKLFAKVGETALLDLQVNSEKAARPVLVASIQRHPVSNQILHIDFHEVALNEKVTAAIPVELVGEAPAVKDHGGIVVHPISEITVQALPTDLPEKFELDLSILLNIGDAFTLDQLSYDKAKVEVTLDPSTVLVTIQAPKEEVVEVPVAAEIPVAPTEGEAEAEAKVGETKPGAETAKPEASKPAK